MFNMGGGELLLVAFVAILFIPPKKLPEVANTLGRLFVKLQNQFTEIKREMTLNVKKDIGLPDLKDLGQKLSAKTEIKDPPAEK